MRPPRRLAHSALGRYAALVAAIFLAAFAVVFTLVATTVSAYTERRIVETIRTDLAGLEEVWRVGALPGLERVLADRRAAPSASTPPRIHLVIAADGERVAGDFAAREAATLRPSVDAALLPTCDLATAIRSSPGRFPVM